jgi:SpoVK/Ycf46/Vps4 family AAA+-type ATPase
MLMDQLPDALHHPYFSILLPPTIKGFGFHNKKWSQFPNRIPMNRANVTCIDNLLVERIEDVQWNKNVFTDDLVLEESKKELIQALVTVHSQGAVKTKTDFIAGKGDGVLILLHGGPGTGKTLTAESVAEAAERPLYRVSSGDIGILTDTENAEKYLDSVLYIGSIWNCVVLLDESDVFFEERSRLDLQRNALVSVFLRALEYFDGILILTSNRIGTIDEAFKSRVQLFIHYPTLNRENRLRVWENFLALIRDDSDTSKFSEIRQRLHSLASNKLNGRQIRNAMNTAQKLAQFKKEPLGYRHLNEAIQNMLEFDKYVTNLHDGQTDEEYAETHGIRYNNKKRKVDDDID